MSDEKQASKGRTHGENTKIPGAPPGNSEFDPKQQTHRRDLPPEVPNGEGEEMSGTPQEFRGQVSKRQHHKADEPDRRDRNAL